MKPDRAAAPAALTGPERSRYVRQMFSRIAARYDLMNRLMTAGQDIAWRKEVIRRARLAGGNLLLDLGAGTGDLSREALRQSPGCRPIAGDFTLEMMRVGRLSHERPDQPIHFPAWCGCDALNLPFPAQTFQAVVSGFLMRNVADARGALAEQRRVLKPGGRIVILDTTRPRQSWLSPLISVYLHKIIPGLGRLLTGEAEAYQYLPDSTEAFLSAEDLADLLKAVGFSQVGFRRLMFGAVAIHWAQEAV